MYSTAPALWILALAFYPKGQNEEVVGGDGMGRGKLAKARTLFPDFQPQALAKGVPVLHCGLYCHSSSHRAPREEVTNMPYDLHQFLPISGPQFLQL